MYDDGLLSKKGMIMV